MSSFVCRVCLCSAVRMHSIEDYNLVETYETMSGSKLNTEDRRPTMICYICVAQLRRCHRFFDRAHKTEGILTYLHQNGIEVPPNDVTVLALAACHDLTVTTLPHFEVGDDSGTMSFEVKVEEYEVVVKEEPAEGEILIDIEENRLPDIKEGALDVATVNCQDREQHESEYFSENEYFHCDVCSKKYSSKRGLIIHLKSCDKTYKQSKHLKPRKTMNTEEKSYVCNTCNKAFTRFSNLKQHILNHTREKSYVCNTCNKAFTRESNLKQHILIHTGEKSFVCNTCNRAFTHAGQLKQHMLIHTGEKPNVCNICNKAFNQAAHLKTHMRIHSGEKPYVCNTCNKAFIHSDYLKRHMLIHTGEKPFVCNTCNKAFLHAGHLKQHMIIHTGEKPHVCNTCNKAFNHAGYLRKHMRIHTGEKPYVCNTCNKAFRFVGILKKHMRIHTGEK